MSEKAEKSRVKVAGRFVHFARGLVSEVKKIVWPSGKQVVNNTVITIVMCLIIGVFIWLLDLGLVSLLNLLLK